MKFFTAYKKRKWFSQFPARVSSGTMILENSVGQALIVKASYKPYWTFPGGLVDPHETPKECAIRETFEEVGIKVDPQTVTFVAVINRKSTIADTYQFVFKAPLEKKALDSILLQPAEIDEYALVTKAQVKTNDRRYGKVIEHWVKNSTGYQEQTFTRGHE